MLRARLLIVVLLAACTPIRPLSTGDAGAGVRDARVPDGAASDAPRDAASDGGCAAADQCDGVDDDCDPTTADGSGDPRVGSPCDGPDADGCAEGTFGACTDGALVCGDASTDTPELCGTGMVDEDCDGTVDEAGASGARTFYLDEDGDGSGSDASPIVACARPPSPPRYVDEGGDCDDTNAMVSPRRGEDCNAVDDDCNGMVDDGSGCADCEVRAFGGHTYLFCNDERTWDAAQSRCAMSGYHLATVEDDAENSYLSTQATALGLGTTFTGGVWIGLRRVGVTLQWTDGTALGTYHPWNSTEPDRNGDCIRIRPAAASWFDSDCGATFDSVCETP